MKYLHHGKGFLVLGLLIQIIVGACFPVLTPYGTVCSYPPGAHLEACAGTPDTIPQTAFVYLWVSGAWLGIVLFTAVAAFVLFATFRGNTLLKATALAVSLLFAIAEIFAATQSLPTQLWGWHIFMGILLVGVLFQGFGQVESLRRLHDK